MARTQDTRLPVIRTPGHQDTSGQTMSCLGHGQAPGSTLGRCSDPIFDLEDRGSTSPCPLLQNKPTFLYLFLYYIGTNIYSYILFQGYKRPGHVGQVSPPSHRGLDVEGGGGLVEGGPGCWPGSGPSWSEASPDPSHQVCYRLKRPVWCLSRSGWTYRGLSGTRQPDRIVSKSVWPSGAQPAGAKCHFGAA